MKTPTQPQDRLPKGLAKAMAKKPSKEEVRETKRQRTLVKDVIYQILTENNRSIKDAITICKTLVVGFDAVFMQDVQAYGKKRSADTLETLKLEDQMNDRKAYKTEWQLVEALKGETVTTAKNLVEGMQKEIERLVDKENLVRPLSQLTTEFLD